jgi:hypothetical protein
MFTTFLSTDLLLSILTSFFGKYQLTFATLSREV